MTIRSKWALSVGSFGNVPVRVHGTFVLLFALGVAEAIAANRGAESTFGLVLIIALLGAVLVHELGHALIARVFKIKTLDVVLYPFGGVALRDREGSPRQELSIALAGPVVSALCCILLTPWVTLPQSQEEFMASGLATRLFAANVVVMVLNFLPVFPLDGGRILRAFLELVGAKRSTETIARLSQVTGIMLGVGALLTANLFLAVLAAVVFANAMAEVVRRKTVEAAHGLTVREAMTPLEYLVCFPHGTSVQQGASLALRVPQPVFPVVHADQILGLVSKDDLVQAVTSNRAENYVAGLASKDFLEVSESESLATLTDRFVETPAEVFVVKRGSELAGLLFRDKLFEFLLVRGIKEQMHQGTPLDDEVY